MEAVYFAIVSIGGAIFFLLSLAVLIAWVVFVIKEQKN